MNERWRDPEKIDAALRDADVLADRYPSVGRFGASLMALQHDDKPRPQDTEALWAIAKGEMLGEPNLSEDDLSRAVSAIFPGGELGGRRGGDKQRGER